jgi:hypothetical protein
MVESAQFFAERAQLAAACAMHTPMRAATKDDLELVPTFLSLRGAEAIAGRRIADAEDRARFLSLVREAMAKSIPQGGPIPDVQLRLRRKQGDPSVAPPRAVKRDDPVR